MEMYNLTQARPQDLVKDLAVSGTQGRYLFPTENKVRSYFAHCFSQVSIFANEQKQIKTVSFRRADAKDGISGQMIPAANRLRGPNLAYEFASLSSGDFANEGDATMGHKYSIHKQ